MDLAAAFAAFAASMFFMLTHGYEMGWGMLAGYAAFMCVGLHRGFSLKELLRMSWREMGSSFIVIRVLLIIGMLTALWRAGGTFALLVEWGLRLISPSVFVLVAYLLCTFLSYSIGTSFGVAGILGVVLITIARSGGVSEAVTAGAIMSGIYFGDRCSPASSCGLHIAAITGTEHYANLRLAVWTSLPTILCCVALYGWLSVRNPMMGQAAPIGEELASAFCLNPWVVLPAVLMLVLPLFKVPALYAYMASIAGSVLCARLFQGMPLAEIVSCAIFGYSGEPGTVKELFNGGGLMSMASMCFVLFVSGTYSGIFEGTGMLDGLQARLESLMRRRSPYAVLAATGLLMDGVFCSQTVGDMMTVQMLGRPYLEGGRTRSELAADVTNSAAVLAPAIPWNIGCSVPLAMLGVSAAAVPYSFYLYLLLVVYGLTKRFWFKKA